MRGWEVTTDMTDEDHPDAVGRYREQLYDMAVSDIGIDRVRLEVRSGAENNNGAWKKFATGQISYQDWRPLRYTTVNDNDDPNVWILYETWKSRADLDAHFEQPYTRAMLARFPELLAREMELAFATAINPRD